MEELSLHSSKASFFAFPKYLGPPPHFVHGDTLFMTLTSSVKPICNLISMPALTSVSQKEADKGISLGKRSRICFHLGGACLWLPPMPKPLSFHETQKPPSCNHLVNRNQALILHPVSNPPKKIWVLHHCNCLGSNGPKNQGSPHSP